METRRLLVIGAPHSGTRYMARVLRAAGVQVGHERVGREGSVSSYFVADDYWYGGKEHMGGRLRDFAFDHVWHQVRHPLAAISSIANLCPVSWWHWQEKHTGVSYDLPPIERGTAAWLAFNELAERQKPELSFTIEHMEHSWPILATRLGIEGTPLPDVPYADTRSTHPKLKVTWEALGSYESRVRDLARHYGYGEAS